jgi:hypothetical protein
MKCLSVGAPYRARNHLAVPDGRGVLLRQLMDHCQSLGADLAAVFTDTAQEAPPLATK